MKAFIKLSVALLLLSACARTHAADFNWKSPISGNASTPGNWQPTGTPGISDTANFNLGSGGYTVDVGNGLIRQINIANDTVTFKGNVAYGVDPELPGIQLGVQSGDVAKLTLSNNTRLNGNQIWIGAAANTEATVTVSGGIISTSRFGSAPIPISPTQIVVGAAGNGTLISTNGSVQSTGAIIVARDANSHGTITGGLEVLGAGLTVGQGGIGSLTLANGRRAGVAGALMIGEKPNSVGNISVTGAQSILDSTTSVNAIMTSATIGGSGKGTLSVTNSGTTNLGGPLVVGKNAGAIGTVTVDGVNSSLSAQGYGASPQLSLTVGAAGQGSFSVMGGATASMGGPIIVGDQAGSKGDMLVTGSRLQSANVGQNVRELVVGASGVGSLTVSNAGVVDLLQSSLSIGKNAGSKGTLTVSGSRSEVIVSSVDVGAAGSGTLSITGGGKLSLFSGPVQNHAGGKISIQGGTIGSVSALTMQVDNSGILINNGSIVGDVNNLAGGVLSGSGTISGTLKQTGGTISPGNSPGNQTVGSLDLAGGTFKFELNSASGVAGGPSGWDLLTSLGQASLSGAMTLDIVSLTPTNSTGNVVDFDPLHNYQWTFLTAGGGITGFNPANFTIDTTDFSNPFGGQFFVSQVGNSLAVNYAVPEPATIVLAAMGLAALLGVKLH